MRLLPGVDFSVYSLPMGLSQARFQLFRGLFYTMQMLEQISLHVVYQLLLLAIRKLISQIKNLIECRLCCYHNFRCFAFCDAKVQQISDICK